MSWKKWTCGLAVVAALAGVQGAWGAYGGSGTFTKITALADLADGYYVIVASNDTVAMNSTNAGTFFTNAVVSPSGGTLTDPAPSIVWLIATNATYGGYTLYSEASAKYASYSGSANTAYAAGAVNGTTGAWTITYASGVFSCANVGAPTRILQYNSAAPRFACYTTAQQKLLLYKMATSSTPPSFTSGTSYGATSLVAMAFTVTATGSPTPTLALQSTTASAGYGFTAGTGQLSYTPPQADGGATQTFTFTASNSAGVATQTVSVAVTAATAPSFTSGTSYGATSLVAMAFTVTASGIPAPTLALQSETAAGSCSFTPGTGVLNFTPATNDVGTPTFTFTASNVAGVVTQVVTVTVVDQPVAPSFTSGTSYGATSLVAMAFTVAASGNPAPALALQSEDAAGSVAFTPATGALDYTPATNDVGNRSFTFTASNTAGVATQTVTVAVAAALTAIPTVSVTNVSTNSFTVNWTACTAATNYQVQIATDTNFTVGGGGSNVTLASVGNTGVSNDWAYVNGASNAGTYHKLVSATAPGVVSAEFSTMGYVAVTAEYAVATYGGSGANVLSISYSLDGGTNWTVFGTNSSATSSTYVTGQANALPPAALGQAGVRIKWHCDVATASVGLRLQSLAVTGVQTDGSGSLVADATVAALTYAATGLVAETAYYVRARKEGGEWSSIVPATTASPTPTAPAFGVNPGPLGATSGVARVFTVTASGFPAPTLALQSQTASSGYSFVPATGVLTYTAPEADAGARTFTFTASNATGVATQTVSVTVSLPPATVPVFGANPGPLGATSGVARAFTVSATGYPTPALSLAGTTASSGYSFTAGTGQLSYAPPAGDVGARTFTFAASNSAGVAMQTVSVSVVSYVPAVAVTNLGTNSFTVNWTEVTGATTYQVQVGTDTNFTGAAVGTNALNESFATLTATTPPSGWTSSVAADLVYTEPYAGAAAPAYKFGTSGQWLLSPTFATGATNLQFWARSRNGAGSTYAISGLVSGVWTLLQTVTVPRTEATFNVPLDPQTTQIKFSFTKLDNCALDDVVVQCAAAAGSLVLDETVAALTYGATDLETATLYYVRVRQTNGVWSSAVSATTYGTEPLAPWFTGGAGPFSTTAGVSVAFSVTAMGVPAPTLALQSSTAAAGSYAFTTNTGYFIYAPPVGDVGAQTFTFTASNATGVATQIVSVSVAAATAPAFTSGTSYGATTLVSRVINVTASGVPEPTLALTGSTASSGYAFSPELGRLSYTAPTNDTGTQTFTFTASNVAGVATQTVSVVVSNMPAAAPTIDAIPLQTTMVGLELDYTVTATDPDTAASNLTFACTSAVASATWAFDTNSGYFYFIPTTNQIGTNVFSFQATDHPTSLTSPWSNMVVVVSAAGDPVSVSFGSARIVGEEGGGTVLIPVKLAYSGSAVVDLRFVGPTNGTARWGTDFNCSTTLVVSGSSSGNVEVAISDDALAEGPESVKVQLVPRSPATAGATTQTIFHLRDNDTVSVMAANITSGSNQEYEDHGNRILQALGPDVVLLQEFNMTNGTTAAAYRAWVDQNFGTNYQYCVQTGVSIPNGVVSRWPISSWGVWDDTTLTDRDFVWAKIELPGTQKLYAVSLHIKASSGYESQRTTETRALTNYIANAGWESGAYIAIGGDFNLQVRTETALSVLTSSIVRDTYQPADQNNNKNTNSGRDNPYDLVLPSTNLNARHRTLSLWGYNYTNGIVFDTRLTWANGLPPPSLYTNSATLNMQHMGVMKVFELEKDATVDDPQAFSATPASASQVDLAYTQNSLGDDVVIVWDNDGTFTAPTGTAPAVGAAFAGGTVLYKGSVSPQSHTGLTSCANYYYKCWSYAGTVYSASGLTANATTATPDAPASVWASATNNGAFTATWSAVAGAASYRLDVCAAPSFSGVGTGWGPVFRETMGTPTAGTTLLADHEAADGFDNDAYAMSSGGADNPADVRTSIASAGYADPAGNAASGGANVFFPTNGLTGSAGFAIEGIDTRGYQALALSFAYNKESATTNMNLALDWSTDGGASWNPVAISNFPANNAATNWYMVSNLAVSASALDSTSLALRWTRAAGSVPGRIDDVLLQGYAASAAFAAGYSNRTVSGATSQSVTGLTGGVTYYFRVAAVGNCVGAFSPTASATPTGVLSVPTFGANPGPLGATSGVARTFTVSASGYPLPTLALQGQTASSGYSFVPATGVLTYTPPEADFGSRTFTFTANNSQGTATQTVAVTVAAGIPSAPASVWASATNAASFTAAWSPVAIASGYRLDVSTVAGFQVASGESVQSTLASNAATDVSLISGDWSGTALVGTNGYVQMLQSSSEIVSPAFSTVGCTNLSVDFLARTFGGGAYSNVTVSISTNNGAAWSVLGVVAPTDGTLRAMATLADAANLGHAQTRIRWQSLTAVSNIGVGVKTLVVKGWGPGFTPSFVAGYSNLAVAGTSQVVAGLTANSTYYFRVRAETAVGASVDSATASVTTLPKSGQTITFPALGAQIATNVLALSATASSGLSVSFAVGSGPATISNGTALAFTGAGTVTIVASQAGDASWNPAPNVTNLFSVAKATAGVTLGSLSQTYDGTPKSATATTVPAGLTVEFTYDGSATAPTLAGSYAVTGTVNDAKYSGAASGTLVISNESLTAFQLWVRDEQGQSLSDPNYATNADYDNDGMTTWEEYLADTAPDNSNSLLALTGQYFIVSASNSTGKIRMSFPASTSRYYQLVYSTNLANPTLTNNLGWGVAGMAVTNNGAGTWFGRLRALLAAP